MQQNHSPYTIKSVERALTIFSLFEDHSGLTLTDISKLTGMNKSTVLRFIRTLCENNYLRYDEQLKTYHLGFMFYVLGSSAYSAQDIRTIAGPVLHELSVESNLIAHLGIMDNASVVVLEKIAPQNIQVGQMFSHVGAVMPLHCTGLGKALLMDQSDNAIRALLKNTAFETFTPYTPHNVEALIETIHETYARGYAMDNCEHQSYIQCISYPVYNVQGKIVAAVSLAGSTAEFEDFDIESKVRLLKNACNRISTLIGGHGRTAVPGM